VSKSITLDLPAEFLELCKQDNVFPDTVLRGFIADLCAIGRGRVARARTATGAMGVTNARRRGPTTPAWGTPTSGATSALRDRLQ
jgi:hypothetical protein